MTHICKGDASLHGLEVFLHVQLVDEFVREHNATLSRLVVLVDLSHGKKKIYIYQHTNIKQECFLKELEQNK